MCSHTLSACCSFLCTSLDPTSAYHRETSIAYFQRFLSLVITIIIIAYYNVLWPSVAAICVNSDCKMQRHTSVRVMFCEPRRMY
jgi:hypothetical protein